MTKPGVKNKASYLIASITCVVCSKLYNMFKLYRNKESIYSKYNIFILFFERL